MSFTNLWLDYRKLDITDNRFKKIYISSCEDTAVTSAKEIVRAAKELYGIDVQIIDSDNSEQNEGISLVIDTKLKDEQFDIECGNKSIRISSGSGVGLLYGAFALIRRAVCGDIGENYSESNIPSNPLRMLDHWDNSDGSIERGYSGNSFFFKDGEIMINERTRAYARIISSVGINGIVINNVNVKDEAVRFISSDYYEPLRELQKILAEYGIKMYLSISFDAPMELGGMDSADPCDKAVAEWWRDKMGEIYEALPGFGGVLIKADSEGRVGPFSYGRTQAEGANMIADAIKPHGGTVIWRCFVYNCHMDWRDRKSDRARASYDNFYGLDGEFEDNVILQIKNGPMDFQVREPVSPLFGAMPKTNQMIEFQIAQEYTGQQIDLCYLIPWFRQVLSFKTYHRNDNDTVADIICGISAVTNTGNDENWTGHELAAANLYGFGRLAFDGSLTAEEIAREWIVQTLGHSDKVMDIVERMLMDSWPTYEKYTAPLGVGWMIAPETHYGPDVDGFEYSRWGTYHYADRDGLGVDRTINGTGFVEQYRPENASVYADVKTCPDELILFFHHLPYSFILKSGKTIIQHIYDTHFEGVEDCEKMAEAWKELKDHVSERVYKNVSERIDMQIENAREWRDRINTYFYRKSGVEDEKGRLIYK